MTLNREFWRVCIARALLAFVVFTLGFSVGRGTAPDAEQGKTETAAPLESEQDRVVVYAAHSTFRCPDCIQIETLAYDLLETEFAAELEEGRLAIESVDFMKNPAFAMRYDVSASTLLVVRFADGEVRDFKRLDEVWTKLGDVGAFMDYVRDALIAALYTGPES